MRFQPPHAQTPRAQRTQANDEVSHWQQQTLQQFFSAINWEDHPPEQQLVNGSEALLSGNLTVNQFFSTINWEGGVVAAVPSSNTTFDLEFGSRDPDLTLDDFSDLF